MSARYTAGGKRRSSMTHARRGHACEFCDQVSFGNGGMASRGRSHVRCGEAVEMVKHYQTYPPMVSRIFVAAADADRVTELTARGFEVHRG